MRFNPVPLIAASLLSLSLTAQIPTVSRTDTSRYTVLLKSGTYLPAANITAEQLGSLNRKISPLNKPLLLIQFDELPDEGRRSQLKAAGVELLDYIPNNTFTAVATDQLDAGVLQRVKVRSVNEWTAEKKMRPELVKGNFPAWAIKVRGTVDIWISFPKTEHAETVAAKLRALNVDILSTAHKEYRILVLRIASQRLMELAALPYIEYVETAPMEDRPLLNYSRASSRANILNASLAVGGRDLQGQNIVVGVGDNADPLHVDFTGRRISRAALPYNYHGTHVHGIVGGGGIWNEKYTGYAPKSTLISQSFSGIFLNAPAYINDYRMVITNNSYTNSNGECVYNGYYDLTSVILDQQAITYPNLSNVFAAGNSGGQNCSPKPTAFGTVQGGYQAAKNTITVGNTLSTGDIFVGSSRGPAKDGRIKPDLTAQGSFVVSTASFIDYFENTGTSMAAPAVSGGLALLYQRYRQLFGAPTDPPNALMKAILCNTATDKGHAGPDYTYGFGWMNLLRAVEALENTQYTNNSVATGGNNVFNINVPANTAQLKVMLYWNDPAAAIAANKVLVNDLDLTVTPPAAPIVLPLIPDTTAANVDQPAQPGVDRINNMEQVLINNPATGTYAINVSGAQVAVNSPQSYFITWDFVPVSTKLTFPVGGEKLLPGELILINWDSYGNPANTFSLEYSTDNGAIWNPIPGGANVAADLRWFVWNVPNTATNEARVRITRNGTGMVSTSQAFTILGAPAISLSAIQCEDYISIDWTAVAGATDYEVMKLQGDEMVTVTTVPAATLTYKFGGLSRDSVYWVTVRALNNGFAGRRDTAVSRQPNSGTCGNTISDGDIKIETIISPASSGRRFTSTALGNSVPLTVRIKNLDDIILGGVPLTFSYRINGGAPVTDPPVILPDINPGGTGDYTFAAALDLSAVGTYSIEVTVTKAGDPYPQDNVFTKAFKQLDNQPVVLPFLDNMDAAPVQSYTVAQMGLQGLDRYDFVNSSAVGRIRTFINTGIAYSGNRALTLDADRFNAGNVDSLTGTYNLTAVNPLTTDLRLDFRYKNHGQQNNAANKVWIRGNDNDTWVQAYDLFANQNPPNGTYRLASSIELSDLLTGAGQTFSTSFQVRWGQQGDNQAADNESGAGYTFDNVRLYTVTDDMQMMAIDSPDVITCGLQNNEPVKVAVRNSRNTDVTNVPVRFRVDGGPWLNPAENIPFIAANSTVQYTFVTAFADVSAPGTHVIEALVDYPTDNYRENDTLRLTINNLPVVNTFPHLQDFEAGNGNWYSEGTHNSWQYGTPVSGKINRAASGSKAWKTNLSGTYNDNELSYLYSPCYDLSGLATPTLSFSVALDLEDCGATFCDGAYVEYSTTNGVTWTRLGAQGQGTNWYNKVYGGSHLWSVQNYTRWHVATIPLTGIPLPNNSVRFRFVMRSDPGVNYDGIAIDDIHIYDNTSGIYDGPTMGAPVSQTINPGVNTWVNFLSGGKLVASVHPGGQEMGLTNVQAYIHAGAVRNNSGQYYLNRNITIQPATPFLTTPDSVFVRFYFLDTEAEALISANSCPTCFKPSTAYDLGVSKYSDPNNSFENGVVEDGIQGIWTFINSGKARKVPFDKGYYAEFKVNDFSEFWLNNGGFDNNQPLPLELADFTARKTTNNKDVLAEWITASEQNINRFEIEVARGNADYQQNRFVKIGEVASQGNSVTEQRYSFTDIELFKNGVRYYRLKIVEQDGSFSYSPIRPVLFNNEVKWIVHPNPSPGIFNLEYQAAQGEVVEVRIYDISGKTVKQYKPVASGFAQKLVIDLQSAGYVPGVYMLEVRTGGEKQVFRLLKQ